MNLKISVAITTYNGEKFIKEQLESILKQKRKPDEIIVCDDCSTDLTLDIVKNTLKNSDIYYKIIKNPNNLGFVKNFEKAISLCKGDIIFISDQDDFWLNEKIEKTEKIFLNDNNCMLVFSNMEIVNENLSTIGYNTWDLLGINEHLTDFDILKLISQSKDIFNGCAMIIRKTVKQFIFPFSEKWGHDLWIIANVALFYDNSIKFIPDKLVLHRRHLFNTSKVNLLGTNNFEKNKQHNYFKKIKKICTNMKENIKFNKERYNAFLIHIKEKQKMLNRNKYIIIKDVYEYYDRRLKMYDKNIFYGFFEILQALKKGLYYKYNNSYYKLAFKDVLSLIFIKFFTHKNL
ncbi:MAG: glycosyltransferase family 2 protein [Bacteroidales bacterium]|nr:glycosyltransferase family 2 protein [Bacteroidales bacterium]